MCEKNADRLQTLITTTIPFFLPFYTMGIFGYSWDTMDVSFRLLLEFSPTHQCKHTHGNCKTYTHSYCFCTGESFLILYDQWQYPYYEYIQGIIFVN